MVYLLDVSGHERGDRRSVASEDGSIEAPHVVGRVVLLHAPALDRRFGRARWRLGDSPHGAPRALREPGRPLGFPELDRARLLRSRLGAAAGGVQRSGEGESRVGVVEQDVGGGGELDGGLRELDRARVLAAPRERLGAHAAPRDARGQIVAGELLALVRERLGLGDAAEREQRAREQCRSLGRVDPQTLRAQPLVRRAQAALRRGGVALDQLDPPREDVGLEQSVRDAELLDHAPRRGDHPARRLAAAAQRLEHALTPERNGLDGRRALRDAQHAHHVEAAAARAGDGRRAREHGERHRGENRVGAAAVVHAPRGRLSAVERGLAGAHPTEPRERLGVDEMSLRLAGGVAFGAERFGCRRDRADGGPQ